MISRVSRFLGQHRRTWLLAGVVLLALAGVWGVGFIWFIRLTAQRTVLPGHADGIVVLTGGAERVDMALRLLAEGRGERLLISGIGGGADLSVLARHAAVDTTVLASRITLGRAATSTHGNARETASWVRENRIGTLIVVTAYYHMPRALVELRQALPGVGLLAVPVLTPGAGASAETGRPVSLRLMAEEYSKYLVALTGVTAWFPVREATQPGARA